MIIPSKWDVRFLSRAAHVASWSKDPSTKVGAVLVKGGKRSISEGYNGFPSPIADDPEVLNNRSLKYPNTIHAELNAIFSARESTVGATCYVWPFQPCGPCSANLVQENVGITRVVSLTPTAEQLERWGDSFAIGTDILRKAGVDLLLFNKQLVMESEHWYRG
jgi:dCMP deaminase